MDSDAGTSLIGWVVGLVGAAGIYAAIKGEPWLDVMLSAVNPKAYTATASLKTTPVANGGGVTATPLSGPVQTVLAYAEAQLGKPYQFGGSGPNTFDCSGLTMRAFETVGIQLPHNALAQFAQTQPWKLPITTTPPAGALVFFEVPIGHVGISLGNGSMIEAPHTGAEVRVSDIAGDATAMRLMGVTNPLASLGVSV